MYDFEKIFPLAKTILKGRANIIMIKEANILILQEPRSGKLLQSIFCFSFTEHTQTSD